MKYLKRINEFNENEFEREDEFRLGHDEQEGDENLYDDEDFYSTEEEEGDEDFRFSNDEAIVIALIPAFKVNTASFISTRFF